MEPRKIIIVNSKTQSQKVISGSTATTLGELKAEMDQLNIPYTGATFLEGRSKVELNDNDALLPTNIPYKGEITNDLVFMLTTPEKKITSGAAPKLSRQDLYASIKELDLEQACIDKYGKNFTKCKNTELASLISVKEVKVPAQKSVKAAEVTKTVRKVVQKKDTARATEFTQAIEQKPCGCDVLGEQVIAMFSSLIDCLYEDDCIYRDTKKHLEEQLELLQEEISDSDRVDSGKLPSDEIKGMFKNYL